MSGDVLRFWGISDVLSTFTIAGWNYFQITRNPETVLAKLSLRQTGSRHLEKPTLNSVITILKYFQKINIILQESLQLIWGIVLEYYGNFDWIWRKTILAIWCNISSFKSNASVCQDRDCTALYCDVSRLARTDFHSIETRILIQARLNGLGVWFSLWVREVPGSNPGWAQFFVVVVNHSPMIKANKILNLCTV